MAFARKTACLASELLVSIGPSPHVRILDAKQRLLGRNNKSLWVPDITCHFVHAKQRDLHRNDKSIWVPALICVFFNMQNHRWGLEPIETSHPGANHGGLHAQNDRLHLGLRYFSFQSKIRCFESKNHTWGLGPIETSYSNARHAVLHAENHTWGLGSIETCNFGPKGAVLNAQTHRWGLGPTETSKSDANHVVLHAQKWQVRYGNNRDL